MTRIRFGEIRFINALPLSLPAEAVATLQLEKTMLAPTGLNRAMLAGQLDVSPVSSACYLRHKDRFVLLDHLSISAAQPVESVLLFLPQGFPGLTPQTTLAIPDSSETSVALMQSVIFQQTGLRYEAHQLLTYPAGKGVSLLEAGMPLLAIGDEALLLKARYPQTQMPHVDLAQVWQEETGLPFVFAVWVAQQAFAEAQSHRLQAIQDSIISQKMQFQRDEAWQAQIIQQAHMRCPQLSPQQVQHYLTAALSYDLNPPHFMALSWFETVLQWLDGDAEYPRFRNRSLVSV